jgi:prevent-host-death family protein
MENTVTATELARNLGDILGKVRYRHETFIVERNGEPIARLVPLSSRNAVGLAEGLRAWRATAGHDPSFADDLERVNAADRPPRNPWE